MRRWHVASLAAVMLAGVGSGCARTVVSARAQSPAACPPGQGAGYGAAQGPIIGAAPGYGEISKRHKHDFAPFAGIQNHEMGYGDGYYRSPYAETRISAYPPSPNDGGYSAYPCGPSYGGGCAGGCHPGCGHNHHTVNYNWPQGLSYPQQQFPAGYVQYPYYTLRGPTDFFMK